MYHLVDVVDSYDESFENMHASLSFVQLETCAANHHFMAVLHKVLEQLFEIQCSRTAVDQSHIINTERRLQLSELEELVEQHTGVGLAFHINDNVNLAAGRDVADVAYAIHLFLLYQVGYALYKVLFHHPVGDFRNLYGVMPVAGHHFSLGSQHHAAATCGIGVAHTLHAENLAACGEIGSLNVLHKVINRHFRVVNQRYRSVQTLGEVMRRHIGSHTHCDAGRAVYQQVRYTRR